MAPELKEMYLAGDITEDFKYDPWKSDVYALAMTLMDAACLKLGQKGSRTEIMKEISNLYGEDYMEFLQLMLEENAENRCDFIELLTHPLYLKLSKKGTDEKLKLSDEEKKKNGENIAKNTVKTSERLYNFIETLPKTNKIGRFYQLLTEIRKIEENNETERQSQELKAKKDKESQHEKVPENYFKYFDCQ